ncbi:hypothetical protein [Cellvibrio polysaccharolyticus]|uniref:Uncharacterized protein n=1 Tax=Cellvibrio polysaccharolyticus TaxID=2082724 RepID=A0A928V0F2_9GAMM|nr:hypothetical protein [Cellvibrio polysaccharolyticus]MBE8716438.1 hypothetical protein [Cellvibrio polysaccharolyticus]
MTVPGLPSSNLPLPAATPGVKAAAVGSVNPALADDASARLTSGELQSSVSQPNALQPIAPQAVNAPGVSVNISATPPVNDVYERPAVSSIWMRQPSDGKKVVSSLISQQLATQLETSSRSKTPFAVGMFFSHAAALSAETGSFANDARQTNMPAGADIKSWSPDFSRMPGKKTDGAVLTLQTRSGATVSMHITRHHGPDGSNLGFGFNVEGELTEAEQKALDKLANKLGSVADDFFRKGDAVLQGLDDVDTEQLVSFDLKLTQLQGDDYVELEYTWKQDVEKGTQRLTGKDIDGYAFDVTVNTGEWPATLGQAPASSIEPFLDIIRRSMDPLAADNTSTRFLVDGLRSLLSTTIELVEDAALADSRVVNDFMTGLPDFNAKFSSAISHNATNYSEKGFLDVTMGQTTRLEQEGDKSVVQQENFYNVSRGYWKAAPGMMNPDVEKGNYTYVNETINESVVRSLAMTGGAVDSMIKQHSYEYDRLEQTYSDHKKVDEQRYQDSDSQLIDLLAQLGEKPDAQRIEQLARDSHAQLFRMGW